VSNLFNLLRPEYPRDFHLLIVLERSSDVREVYDRLKGEGVHFKLDFRVHGLALVFQCLGPDKTSRWRSARPRTAKADRSPAGHRWPTTSSDVEDRPVADVDPAASHSTN
jgi:hypothetical protein